MVVSMRALVSRMHAHAFALFERAVEERHCAWWVPFPLTTNGTSVGHEAP